MPRGRVQTQDFRYYKFLNNNGASPQQNYPWPLPNKNEDGTWDPGAWVTYEGKPNLCRSGLHFVRSDQKPHQWIGPRLFEAEVDTENADVGFDKVSVKKARLIREIESYSPLMDGHRWNYPNRGFARGFGKRWKDRKVGEWVKKNVSPEVRYYLNNQDRQLKLRHKLRMLEAKELHARASRMEGRITNERYGEIVKDVTTELKHGQEIFDKLNALRNCPLEVALAGSKIRKYWYSRVPKKEEAIKRQIAELEARRRACFRAKEFTDVEAELGDPTFFLALMRSL